MPDETSLYTLERLNLVEDAAIVRELERVARAIRKCRIEPRDLATIPFERLAREDLRA